MEAICLSLNLNVSIIKCDNEREQLEIFFKTKKKEMIKRHYKIFFSEIK